MKILLLTDKMEVGGAETHVATLALALAKSGVSVTVASAGGRLADELEAQGIPQWRLPLSSRSPLQLFFLRRYLARRVEREGFALLHAHARIPAFLIRKKGAVKKGGGPVTVVTAHARFRPHPPLSRLCYWGDATVAVSEDLRAHLCSVYRVPAERITVIGNGVDCKHFAPRQTRVQRIPLPSRSRRVLFASRLDADCSLGAELLLELAPTLCRDLPHLQITLVGGGSEYARLCRQAERINGELGRAAVRMTGTVRDMADILCEQDVFVGVSRAAMEAAACGCAVILCGNEGYLGILERENAELALLSNFCARGAARASAARLGADLRRLLYDRATAERNGLACRRVIERFADAALVAEQTLALYRRLLRPAPEKVLLIGGYYGCGNLGDDAVLLGFSEQLQAFCPTLRVLALSGSPRRDSGRLGIPCHRRKNPFSVLAALLRCDLFLCGGGSLLQDQTGRLSPLYYLALLRLASLFKKTALLYSAGIGPLLRRGTREAVAKELARLPYISLRDERSLRTLLSLGLDPRRLHTGADPALLLPKPPPLRARAMLLENGLDLSLRFLGVIVKKDLSPSLARLLRAVLRTVRQRHSLTPLFLTLDTALDRRVTRSLCKEVGGVHIPLREPSDAVAILGSCEVVLSMRLHGAILAALGGAPTVAVSASSAEGKLAEFALQTDQAHFFALGVTAADLVEALEDSLDEKEEKRAFLARRIAEMQKKARKDLANILRMVYNKEDG